MPIGTQIIRITGAPVTAGRPSLLGILLGVGGIGIGAYPRGDGSNDNLRSIEVTYSNGTVVHTSMAAHLTDKEMLDYFKPGSIFNIGDGPNDLLAKVIKVKITK
jgi:hypothetical protein